MKLEELKSFDEKICDYIMSLDLDNLALGKHFLDGGIFYNVETYNSKPRHQYEAHKRFIDIQIIIKGKEKIIVDTLENTELKIKYNEENDISFFYDNNSGNEYQLNEKECLILYPEDVHMPCVMVDEPVEVKKVVFKIPLSRVKTIKCLVMDVDGTLSDGKIYMGNDGECFKAFNAQDGYGIAVELKKKGITPAIITGRTSKIVENRAKELGIEYVCQGIKDKNAALISLCEQLNIGLDNMAYIGDDGNDLPCIGLINENGGLTACPKNGHQSVKDKVNFISSFKGGKGAVREFIDWIINE